MKLASYNVENLFLRARALNQDDWADGKDALQTQASLNALLAKAAYSAADKTKIIDLLDELGLRKDDSGGKFALLRQNHGRLLTRHNDGTVDVVANGRADWIGWVDLKVEEVNQIATQQTGRVIRDVDADILALVEAESRPALLRFSQGIITPQGGGPYEHIMLIDGNDERGIDVGIMLKPGYTITSMLSHVDDRDDDGLIFSRDCPAYNVRTPKNNDVAILVNHLKSKGFGSQGSNDQKRLRQAAQVKRIYDKLVASGQDLIAIVGDFNDTLDSDPLAPLRQANLKDISTVDDFDIGPEGRSGTFKNCTDRDKIDHILLSPALLARAQRGGIFRKGVWGGKNGDLFEHYPEITREIEAASDHAAIWAEIDV